METEITIRSEGIDISGVLHRPDKLPATGKAPAIITIHGFGGSKIDQGMVDACRAFRDWGYVALRLDMRGCGQSGGTPGRIISFDQVADTRNAVSWLAGQDGVDAEKICLLGDSMGGAVAAYTGSTDDRVAAVISVGGWGHGAEKLKCQHPGPGAWEKFLKMLEDGRRHRQETGESLWVSRFDIVPIPEHMRGHLPADAVMEFPVETAQSIFDFRPNRVLAQLAPRPLLLLHASKDAVTPTGSSIDMFQCAGRPTDLMFLSDVDHFPLAVGNKRIYDIIKGWLDIRLPLS